jgi:hypothetical protein
MVWWTWFNLGGLAVLTIGVLAGAAYRLWND